MQMVRPTESESAFSPHAQGISMLVLLRKFLSSLRILHNSQVLLVSAVWRERGRCVVRVLEVGADAIGRWRVNRLFSRVCYCERLKIVLVLVGSQYREELEKQSE